MDKSEFEEHGLSSNAKKKNFSGYKSVAAWKLLDEHPLWIKICRICTPLFWICDNKIWLDNNLIFIWKLIIIWNKLKSPTISFCHNCLQIPLQCRCPKIKIWPPPTCGVVSFEHISQMLATSASVLRACSSWVAWMTGSRAIATSLSWSRLSRSHCSSWLMLYLCQELSFNIDNSIKMIKPSTCHMKNWVLSVHRWRFYK